MFSYQLKSAFIKLRGQTPIKGSSQILLRRLQMFRSDHPISGACWGPQVDKYNSHL